MAGAKIIPLKDCEKEIKIHYAVPPTPPIEVVAYLYHRGKPKETLLLMAHGSERTSGGTHGAEVRSFGFLSPRGYRLIRDSSYPGVGKNWAVNAVARLEKNPEKFSCVGIPAIYLNGHCLDPDPWKHYGAGQDLAAAVEVGDILTLEETLPAPEAGNPELAFYRLFHGDPALFPKYKNFVMHACRSLQEKAGVKPNDQGNSAPSHLYSFAGDTKIPVGE